jgi:hypothetical protein
VAKLTTNSYWQFAASGEREGVSLMLMENIQRLAEQVLAY